MGAQRQIATILPLSKSPSAREEAFYDKQSERLNFFCIHPNLKPKSHQIYHSPVFYSAPTLISVYECILLTVLCLNVLAVFHTLLSPCKLNSVPLINQEPILSESFCKHFSLPLRVSNVLLCVSIQHILKCALVHFQRIRSPMAFLPLIWVPS